MVLSTLLDVVVVLVVLVSFVLCPMFHIPGVSEFSGVGVALAVFCFPLSFFLFALQSTSSSSLQDEKGLVSVGTLLGSVNVPTVVRTC